MATELLPIGIPTAIAQTTVYALPTRAVTVLTSANLNISNNTAMSNSFVVVATSGPMKISGGFVQCTAATNCIVTFKVD